VRRCRPAQAAARRKAEASGRDLLGVALADVPWATPGASLDEATRARALAHARPRAAELRPDGSWRVTMALPLEAVRVAAHGARVVDEATDERGAITALVLDARALTLTPALGLGATIGTVSWRGPVLWTDGEPPATMVGDRPITREATGVAGDQLVGFGELSEPAAGALLIVRVTPAQGGA
jgi:hypothetical protein